MKKNYITFLVIATILFLQGCANATNSGSISEKDLAILEKKNLERQIIGEADYLAKGYFFDEALEMLVTGSALTSNAIDAKISEINKMRDSLVKYEGPTHHVFFHSLIVYPELAFDNKGHPAQGYNMWMTTVTEFKKMLPLLLDRGYVLYDITDLIEPDILSGQLGKVKLKDIYLLPGKIPLILSVDDVNYYPYMKKDGFASKLVVNSDGEIETLVVAPDGSISFTRDGDVVPILDDFVKEHPEFSYKGAKGVLALTGFEGALGYRIYDYESQNKEELDQNTADAKKVADALKAKGWKFASHSYTHNQYFNKMTITMDQMRYDTQKWLKYIGPVVGETNVYISPFGILFKKNDTRYRYLVENGFNIFCSVGNSQNIRYNEDNITMSRINLDGFSMLKRPDFITNLYFDVDKVLDKRRPNPDF